MADAIIILARSQLGYPTSINATARVNCYQQALANSHSIGHRRGEGNVLGNLGNAYLNLGKVEKAIDYLEQALAIFKGIKSPCAAQAGQQLEYLRSK